MPGMSKSARNPTVMMLNQIEIHPPTWWRKGYFSLKRFFLKVAHHSLASWVADVHGKLHGDRHGGDDQAVPHQQQDVDGHLDCCERAKLYGPNGDETEKEEDDSPTEEKADQELLEPPLEGVGSPGHQDGGDGADQGGPDAKVVHPVLREALCVNADLGQVDHLAR